MLPGSCHFRFTIFLLVAPLVVVLLYVLWKMVGLSGHILVIFDAPQKLCNTPKPRYSVPLKKQLVNKTKNGGKKMKNNG